MPDHCNGLTGCSCQTPGLTMKGAHVEEIEPGKWVARSAIDSIFGASVDGELKGQGATEQEAIAALSKARAELYEALWA